MRTVETFGESGLRILYFSQFYPPESIAGAFRAAEHAEAWVERGAEVTVFTGWPNYPTGSVFAGYDVIMLAEETVSGVRVLRSKLVARPNTNVFRRVVNGMSFLVYGAANILFNGKRIGEGFDVVLASSGTVFAGYLGLLYAKTRRLPLVVEFRDITYEQMVATGTSRWSWKVRLMRRLELHLAKASARVVVLTKGFKELLCDEGVDGGLVSVVPNGADAEERVRDENPSELVLGYYGTMGISQNVPETLEYAAAIERLGIPVRYFIVGEGAARSDVEGALAAGRYPFARLMRGMPKQELEAYYRKTDLSIVSLQRSDSFKATLPSKVLQSFARGIPVLFIGPEGEAARLVRESGAGIALTGGRGEDLSSLEGFFSDPGCRDELKAMGGRALKTVEGRFMRKDLASRMLETLKDAADERGQEND